MNQILVAIKPFDLKQKIDIYKDEEHLYADCKLPDLEKKCIELCKKNDINQIILIGQKDFALKIKEKINTLKYDDSDIEVKVITQSL